MHFSVTSLDMVEDFDGVLPLNGKILRQIPGSDRPDYYLAELDSPFIWKAKNQNITHIIITARWVGGTISAGMRSTPVNIAYVTDSSQLSEEKLDFKKCYYAAIGVADGK
jgi:hypothetical protein